MLLIIACNGDHNGNDNDNGNGNAGHNGRDSLWDCTGSVLAP